jgi:VCBS repeat-containing protein
MNQGQLRNMTQCVKRTIGAALIAGALAWNGSALAFSTSVDGQNNGSTNWVTVGTPLTGWAELDQVTLRLHLTGAAGNNQTVTITFDHAKNGTPGVQDLVNFSTSANTVINSGPTLTASTGSTWTYTLVVSKTDANPGDVFFFALLAAGSHNFPGASMSVSGAKIKQPLLVSGTPDLAVTKFGPTNANPNQIINYSLRWSVAKPGDPATGVQLSDQLPTAVTFVSASGGGSILGNTLTWTLFNQKAGAGGRFIYSAVVASNAINGSTFQNNAQILSAQNDINPANNTSIVTTRISLGCILPTISDPPLSGTNCIGSSVTLDVVANGSNPLRYQWRKDTAPISGATNSTYTIASLVAGDAGAYDVVVSNACGTATSSNAVLTVTAPPTSVIDGSAIVCAGATGLVYSNSGTALSPTYSWSILGNGSITSSTTNSTVTVNAIGGGGFTLTSIIFDGVTGCSASTNLVVNTADITPPDITQCATNILGSANAGCQAAVPSFTNAVVASDNCSAITISQSPAIGTLVDLGTNTVTIRVADLDGNTNTCTAAFIVSDTTPPTITCPGNVTVNADLGQCSATGVNLGSPVATDNCGVASVTNDAPGSFALGTNIVTWTVADIHGNQITCQQQVIVIDSQNPSITCPAAVTVDTDLNSCSASGVNLGTPVTSDNCSVASVANNAPASFPLGTNTVTWTVTDGSGNIATCNQSVIVVDTMPPQITCPANKTVLAAPGATNAVVSFSVPLVTDNCGVAGTTCTPASGSLFPFGTTVVSCTVTDNSGNTASCSFTVTVKAVNAAPVANDDDYATDAGTTLTVTAPGVLSNDTDAENDPLTAVLVNPPAFGTIVLNSDGSFVYTPIAGFTGTDAFTYRASDSVDNSDIATVTITINAVNHAPLALADSYTTNTNTPLNVTAAGVLANDIDSDGDTLSAIQVSNPAHGSLAFSADGSFLYTPNTDFVGFDSFTYAASDGIATSAPVAVAIGVGLNDNAPLAGNDNYATDEDTALTITAPGVLANDTGDHPLTAVFVSGPQHGAVVLNADGSFMYTPSEHFSGADFFVYRANDGIVNSSDALVTITVNSTNHAPEVLDVVYNTPLNTTLDVATPGVLSGALDAEGDALAALVASGPSHGALTLNADGSFTFVPDNGFAGVDSFTFAATDGMATSTAATATIYIGSSNHVPVANNDSYAVDEGNVLNIAAPGVLANDIDADGDPLTAILAGNATHGTVSLNADGSFTYTPDPLFYGSDSFTYRANDGTVDSGVVRVFIVVNHVNHPPVVQNSTPSVNEDGSLNVPAPGALAGATDADGDPLTAVLISGPSHGDLNFNADGSYDYTPTPLFNGTDCFSFAATDGTATSTPATVCVTVTHVNHAPVANDDNYSTSKNTALNLSAPGVLGNDTDADGDALTAVLVSSVTHGSLTFDSDGSFLYTPANNFVGNDTFSYKANDGELDSGAAIVTITVTGVANQAPVANNDSYATATDATLDVAAPGVLANDADADSDSLTAILVSTTTNGVLTFNANGSFTYVPNDNFVGTDSFVYKANDGSLDSGSATVTITVAPSSGASDVDLYASSESFKINWATTGRDQFKIKGKINPRGARTDLTGATMQISINGTNIFDPVTLDSRGMGSATVGQTKVKAKLNSSTGAYSYQISGLDLRDVVGLPNATGSGLESLDVVLVISYADLQVTPIQATLENQFKTTAGKTTSGRFAFKKNRTITGVFNWNKTSATQLKDGTFKVTGNGVIENFGGTGIAPIGYVRVTIGGASFNIPAANVKFSLNSTARSFKISASGLVGTGIPISGANGPTVYELPIMFEVPVTGGTNVFETVIELKRPSATATKWKR